MITFILECHQIHQVYSLWHQPEHRGELTLLVDWSSKDSMIEYMTTHNIGITGHPKNVTMRVTRERINQNVLSQIQAL